MMDFPESTKYGNMNGIYKIVNKINGKVYIGQTKQPFNKRFMYHRWQLRNNKHDNKWLQNAFNKYGEDAFSFEIIELIDSAFDSLINEEEMRIIQEFRDKKLCYNLSDGGDGTKGVPMKPENLKRLAELNRILNTGKHHSEETKRKMSESRREYYKDHEFSKERSQKRTVSRQKKLLNNEYSGTVQKLTPDTVKEIKIALMNGEKQANIAEKYNVAQTNISAIKNGRSWTFIDVPGWEEYTSQLSKTSHANSVPSSES